MMAVDSGFPRSLRGAIKLARALVAGVAFICFIASSAPGAYTSLAIMEVAITGLFFLLYLLKLDQKLSCLFWPLADVFNSVIAAVFLLIVCLCAVILGTNTGTLAGGVFGLMLLVLCVVDAALLSRKISIDGPRGTNTPAK
ncbi:PREDICTED: chemokine-like factor [Calidris pugnax]|uniref:chemokine-like factor n=1 Tax=Calidris pugnax TaxID=198806 RepID=UPI00071C5728|nr:PREDICTED: chemokine-like factor [Calidris pugnax]